MRAIVRNASASHGMSSSSNSRDLEALEAGTEIEIEQPRAEHHVHLVDVRQLITV